MVLGAQAHGQLLRVLREQAVAGVLGEQAVAGVLGQLLRVLGQLLRVLREQAVAGFLEQQAVAGELLGTQALRRRRREHPAIERGRERECQSEKEDYHHRTMTEHRATRSPHDIAVSVGCPATRSNTPRPSGCTHPAACPTTTWSVHLAVAGQQSPE
jgi:hypothetical protein